MQNKKIKSDIPIHIFGFSLMVVAGWVDIISMNVFINESSSFLTGSVLKLRASLKTSCNIRPNMI